ncbi:hypothetical protein [Micromonospora sp. WMMD1274]|uniref:hypothetical protein n=1 Tax=Micromonospora sp. WMMD1274 TaxID=3404116 RepID=UPI003B92B267
MIVYRADVFGLTQVAAGMSSWTSSREYAEAYTTAAFAGFGGPCLYRGKAEGRVLDLRSDPAAALAGFGLDLADYSGEPLHDTLRILAPLFAATGFRWLAFCEHPNPLHDEWLYVGPGPVACHPVDQRTR